MNNSAWGGQMTATLLADVDCLYFAGVCGISMAGLARMAVAAGYTVRGCDRDNAGPAAQSLCNAGILVESEYAANPENAGLLIYTAAIPESHPAIMRACAAGIPICSRSDFAAALMFPYPVRIAVAGMHGKSTTVGMLTAILEAAGLSPTVSAGAPLIPGGDAFRCGEDKIFLCEACEYRDSFLSFSPTLSVITNIELDHPDYFRDLEAVQTSFSRFMGQSNACVIGGDCPALSAIAPADAVSFGFGTGCNLRGEMSGKNLSVFENGILRGSFAPGAPGIYNCANALAAIAAARHLQIPYPVIFASLSAFHGVGRRMEPVGTVGGAVVYLDYAHHPTEIEATVQGARSLFSHILCVFQPHTYTRTRALWDDFVRAIRLPDVTILTDIYAARESPLQSVTSRLLAEAAGVGYAPDFQDAAHRLRAAAKPGDCILVMGAGDIDGILPFLLL